MKKLGILFGIIFFSASAFAQVEIERTAASIQKIRMIYGEFDPPIDYDKLSYVAISEANNTLVLGNTYYMIDEIIVSDNITTYMVKDQPTKEFVYDPNKNTLTQKNIAKDRRTGELQKGKFEVWFVYTLIL